MCQSEHTPPRAIAPLRDATPNAPLPHESHEPYELCDIAGTGETGNAGQDDLRLNAPADAVPDESAPAGSAPDAPLSAQTAPDNTTGYVLHGVPLRRVFPGIPKCLHGWAMPAHLCASLFNPWAFMLGPAYTLYRGLWGKSLFLIMISLGLSYVPDVNNTGPVTQILAQSYALELYILASNHGLFVADYPTLFMYVLYFVPLVGLPLWTALLMAGHWRCATITGAVGAVTVSLGILLLPPFDLGISNALPWLVARELWPAVAALGLYTALGGLYPALAGVGFAACMLYALGLPVQQLDLSNFLYYTVFVLTGMMTNLDIYRRGTLKQFFWW